jgi:hypothetical protein
MPFRSQAELIILFLLSRGHLQMGLAPQGEIKAQKCQDNKRRDKDHKKDQFQSCNGISSLLQAVFASNPFLCPTGSLRQVDKVLATTYDKQSEGFA